MTVSIESTSKASFGSDVPKHDSGGLVTPVSSSTSLDHEPVQISPEVRIWNSSDINWTGIASEITAKGRVGPAPIERVYPHLFDDTGLASQTRTYINKALRDAQLALESYGEADLAGIGSRLTLVAAAMGSAYTLTGFNASLGGVISFVRRSTLTASCADVTRSALNALIHVLQSVVANPMLDLDEASDLVDKLSAEGWRGEHGVVNELITALFDSQDAEVGTDVQARLFDDNDVKRV